MSKKYYEFITFIIALNLIFAFFGSSFVYAFGEDERRCTTEGRCEGDPPVEPTKSDESLPTSINLHLGEDGLVKLTDKSVDNMATWKVLIIRYKAFIVGIAGFAAVTMVVLFIKNFIKLGAVASNPQARSETLKGLLVTGIATGLLGSVALITSLFYNSIK